MRELDRSLGAAIRRARLERDMTLGEVAARTEGALRPSSIGSHERAERALSVHQLVVIARALGEAPEALLAEALTVTEPARGPVTVDLNLLPDDDVGRRVAAFAHAVRSRRGDYLSRIITFRAGDVAAIASSAGVSAASVLRSVTPAIVRLRAGTEPPTEPVVAAVSSAEPLADRTPEPLANV
jgi:hypothetical protein